ncbi:winged helix-turn-helix transcriptional regulator [Acidipila rosea]|jgi:DNA-binding HxlR family transcriptional regulator|uniref:winged helix-turn-helix transcriptional regulator n=1 Tax=Acidipila rosea TaxID=768535 RepID=UPI0010484480
MIWSSPKQAFRDSTNQSPHLPRRADKGPPNYASCRRERQERVASRTKVQGGEGCSAQFAINLIQGKWKMRILSRLQHGPARLSELRRMFPEASKKMLTQHLRELEKDGLVVRTDLSGRLPHVEYSLSNSRGLAALSLIDTLAEWSREYLSQR